MPLPDHIQAHIDAANTGQIAVGTGITQNQYMLEIGSVHGGVAYLVAPGEVPRPKSRPAPVILRPRPFPDLLDREAEVAAAGEALGEGLAVEFYGSAGVGKTAMQRHLAHTPEGGAYTGGLVYGLVGGMPLADLLQWVFEAFYTCDIPLKLSQAEIRHYLQETRALLFLDDVDLNREEVEQLMGAAPGCTFVLSAKERRLVGEGRSVELQGLPLDAALLLIEKELGRPLSVAERPLARDLCAIHGGHPLRLLQAAAEARQEGSSLQEVVRRHQDGGPPGIPVQEGEPSLSEKERCVLAVLAVLEGAAVPSEHLAVLADLPDSGTILDDLLQRGLLQVEDGRYVLPGNLASVLKESWDLEPYRKRVLSHFIDWADRHRADRERLTDVRRVLVKVLQVAAAAGLWRQVMDLGKSIEGVLALTTRWGAWEAVLKACEHAAKQLGNQAAQAWALHQVGTRALCLGESETARASLQEALRLRETLGDETGAAFTRHNLDLVAAPPPTREQPEETAGGGGASLLPSSGILKALGVLVALLLLGLGGYVLINRTSADEPSVQPDTPGRAGNTEPPSAVEAPEVSLQVVSAEEVQLVWRRQDGEADQFVIERRAGGGEFVEVDRAGPAAASFNDGGLQPNMSYTYRVGAVGGGGDITYSEPVSGLTLPAAPEALSAQAVSPRQVAVKWSYRGPVQPAFVVERAARGAAGFSDVGRATSGSQSYTDRGVTPGTAYRYRVRAVNASGSSSFAGPVEVATPPEAGLAGIVLSQSVAVAGGALEGKVGLTEAAPEDEAQIRLRSSDEEVATVPDRVTVPAGGTAVTFPVETNRDLQQARSVTFTASYGGQTRTVELSVRPRASAELESLTVTPSQVTGGETARGTVTLTRPPAGDTVVVRLASRAPEIAAVPAAVEVAPGQSTATFPVKTSRERLGENQNVTVTITAAYRNVNRSTDLVVGGGIQ